MGMTWTNLTDEELCDLMCGRPENDYDGDAFILASTDLKKNSEED